MTRGNDLHNGMFDHEEINHNADEATKKDGDGGVLCLGQQKDQYGATVVPKKSLAELLDDLAGSMQRVCLLFFSCRRTMFLRVDSSHSHLLKATSSA